MPSPESNFNKTEYCYGYTIYKISYTNPFNKTQQEPVLISDMRAFSEIYSDTLPSMVPIGTSITYYGTSQFSSYTKIVPWFAMYITSTYRYTEEGHQLLVMVGNPSRRNELGLKYISPSSITCIAIIYNKTYRQFFKEDTSIDNTGSLTLDYNKIYDNIVF